MATTSNNPPVSAAFVRPPEWHSHNRIIMAWPDHKNPSYGGSKTIAQYARQEVSEIALAIARFEPVELLVTQAQLDKAQAFFAAQQTHHPITVRCIPGDELDLWMRDIAPIFTTPASPRTAPSGEPGSLRAMGFKFNGWGDKLFSQTTREAAKHLCQGMPAVEYIESSLTLEGGALETDGEGTLLATESSILNENRNPGKSKQDIEAELGQCFGITKFIWIPGRDDLDITDCHIDALARFIKPGQVLLSRPFRADVPLKSPDGKEWVEVYREAREILSAATDAQGRKLDIVEVEEGNLSKFRGSFSDDEEVPSLSYVNYLLVNGGVIIPVFGIPETDKPAKQAMERLFGPERSVVSVRLRTLPVLGGGIHCATQEVPNSGAATNMV